MDLREQIIEAEAAVALGTPYHHFAMVKGAAWIAPVFVGARRGRHRPRRLHAAQIFPRLGTLHRDERYLEVIAVLKRLTTQSPATSPREISARLVIRHLLWRWQDYPQLHRARGVVSGRNQSPELDGREVKFLHWRHVNEHWKYQPMGLWR